MLYAIIPMKHMCTEVTLLSRSLISSPYSECTTCSCHQEGYAVCEIYPGNSSSSYLGAD